MVNEHVVFAILQGNRDNNFDQAMERVVSDVQGLAARSVVVSGNKP